MSSEYETDPGNIENIRFLDEATLSFAKEVVLRALEKTAQPDPEVMAQIARHQSVLDNPDSDPRDRSNACSAILGLWSKDERSSTILEEVLHELDLNGEASS